jgi:protein phosphatase
MNIPHARRSHVIRKAGLQSPPFAFLEAAGRTDIGRRRANNEDALLCLPAAGLFCVADGMGGGHDGEVASGAIVDSLSETVTRAAECARDSHEERTRLFVAALNRASHWIRERTQALGLRGTGSTVVALSFSLRTPNLAMALYAGDSRLYRWRHGALALLTRDHSLAVEAGYPDAAQAPYLMRDIITRAIGIEASAPLEVLPVDVQTADIFLLCTDGLTKMCSDQDLTDILRLHTRESMNQLADWLIGAANKAGGDDNISVLCIRVGDLTRPAD